MAINTNSSTGAAGANSSLADALTAASRATAAADASVNATSRVRAADWMEQGAQFKDPIRRNLGTEAVNNIVKGMVENLSKGSKAFTDNFATNMVVLDKTIYTTLAFSCILVCVKEKAPGAKVVSYHTLIIESTNDGNLTRNLQVGDRTIEIKHVAGDAYDGELIRVAQTVLENEYPGCSFSRADVTRIPRAFAEDPAAKEAKHFLELVANTVSACYVDLQIRAGIADINMTASRGDKSLTVELDFKDRDNFDILGEPIRSDVNVRFFSEQRAQQNNTSLNNGSVSTPIAHASGFIDLSWSPAQADQVNGFGLYNQSQPAVQATQKYAANLVLTDVLPEVSPTPAAVMLTILTAAATVRESNNYYGAFVPKHHLGGKIDAHDIGAINYEMNIGNVPPQDIQRIDTTAAVFSIQDCGRLLAGAIRPGLAISVDVPETDPSSYYMSFLRAAALGEPGAVELVTKCLDELTGGRFRQYFTSGNIFVDNGTRVHGGTYVSSEGELRDIRDVDYLYLLNSKQAGFLETVTAWSDARLAKNVPVEERLHRSLRIIQAMLPSANVVKYYHRVTFSDDLITAGLKALHDCGMAPRIRTPFNAGDMNHQRQVAQAVTDALGNPNSHVNLFSFGGGGMGAQSNTRNMGAATRYQY